MRIKLLFPNSEAFLASIQTMYRMDRGDRIYVKRHFTRWLDIARILEEIEEQNGFMKILDVGCGSGFFMLMFGGRLIGLDDTENVAVCRRRGLQAYSIDLEKDYFPFKNETFDVTVCLEVLEHLENPTKVLGEIFRVLKSNGYLLISTPNNRVPIWRIRDFLLKFGFISRIYMGRKLGSDQKRYSKNELEGMLLSHNFEVQSSCYSRILLPRDDLLIVAKKRSRELNWQFNRYGLEP
jgi:2-polyprenyl-3-methyl-5-hydroxy-6-metoxy-1,4-benzoquinol methylase